jgi:hypothetical protein
MVDCNGRGVTPETIGNHIWREERKEWEVQVEQVFRLEEARDKVRRGEIRVEGAKVVVDCMTNDVRGTRAQRPAEKLDRLEVELNHARMESVVEKRKEVERMKGVVGEIREKSLGQLREDWRREKDAMKEWVEPVGIERERVQSEMEGQMEEMRKMEELREWGGEDREERRRTQRGPWG